jgi:hypothetical protein
MGTAYRNISAISRTLTLCRLTNNQDPEETLRQVARQIENIRPLAELKINPEQRKF